MAFAVVGPCGATTRLEFHLWPHVPFAVEGRITILAGRAPVNRRPSWTPAVEATVDELQVLGVTPVLPGTIKTRLTTSMALEIKAVPHEALPAPPGALLLGPWIDATTGASGANVPEAKDRVGTSASVPLPLVVGGVATRPFPMVPS